MLQMHLLIMPAFYAANVPPNCASIPCSECS